MHQWRPTDLFASQLATFAADGMLSGQARHSGDHTRSQSKIGQLGFHKIWNGFPSLLATGPAGRVRSIVELAARILAEKTIRTTQGYLVGAMR